MIVSTLSFDNQLNVLRFNYYSFSVLYKKIYILEKIQKQLENIANHLFT